MGETLRLATYGVDLARFGPGLVLQDLTRGKDPETQAALAVIVQLNADVLLLTGIDWDLKGQALDALKSRLAEAGLTYPHSLALRPNSGQPSGIDLNADGQLGTPDDAQGFGHFAGQGGMALLSRYPIDPTAVQDFSGLLWADLPGNLAPDMGASAAAVQRLSSTGHWDVPISLPNGTALHVLCYSATPPVFDGAEDRNGRRNHDETAFWLAYLSGRLPYEPPTGPVAILGTSNLDPSDGDGRPFAVQKLLHHPAVQDPQPKGSAGRDEPGQQGDPALDTALFTNGAGGLRVDIVLPPAAFTVTASGVMWPPEADPFAATLALASRHRPVWVDVSF